MQIPLVHYDLGTGTPITPSEPLPVLPEIPRGSVVVLTGRAPIWRYGMAFHLLHGSPAAAVGTFDPRLGVVIVATHTPKIQEGAVFDVAPDQTFLEL